MTNNDKDYRRVHCWRCDRPLLVDMNTNPPTDSRGRVLVACKSCEQAIEKLDRKGL